MSMVRYSIYNIGAQIKLDGHNDEWISGTDYTGIVPPGFYTEPDFATGVGT
jgi:hypothetical protein